MGKKQEYIVELSFADKSTKKLLAALNAQKRAIQQFNGEMTKTGLVTTAAMGKATTAAKKTTQEFGRMRVATEGLRRSIGQLRNILLLYYFVYNPLKRAITSVTKAAMDQENAERALAAAAMSTKKITEAQTKAMIKYAGELQNLSGISDNEIIKSQALMTSRKFTNDQIKEAIPLMVDWTAFLKASGKEQETVTNVTRRFLTAMGGRVTTLRTYGISLSDTTMKTKAFGDILTDVRAAVEGNAKMLGMTYTSTLKKTSEAWGDLTEAIGEFFTESIPLRAALTVLATKLNEWETSLDSAREESEALNDTWIMLIATGTVIHRVVSTMSAGFQTVAISIEMALNAFVLLTTKLEKKASVDNWITRLGAKWGDATGAMTGYMNKLQELDGEGGGAMGEELQSTLDAARLRLAALTEDLEKVGVSASKALSGESVEDFKNNIIQTVKDIHIANEQLKKELSGLSENNTEEVADQYDALEQLSQRTVTTMRNTFVDGFFRVIHGETVKMKDVFISMGDIIIKKLLEIVATEALVAAGFQNALGQSTGSKNSLFGTILSGVSMAAGMFSPASPSIAGANASIAGYAPGSSYTISHLGGPVKGKKYHSGGRVDEVNATLLEGEGVLNRPAMSAMGVDNLNKLNRGQGGGGSVTNYYNINAIDVQSFRDRLEENGDIFQDAVESGINNNESIRSTMKTKAT